MATEKMHRRLVRTDNDSRKLSIRRKFKEENSLRTSLEEWEAVARRKFYRRSAFLTLLSLEPDDSMRVVSLPLRCRDGTNSSGSGARMSMESLRLFYTKPPDPLMVIRPNVPQGSQLLGIYCGKSFTNGISAVSSPKAESPKKELANEATNWNELSTETCQESVTCGASSSMMETGSSSKSFSDSLSGSEKVDNIKGNSIKKRKKKGKKGNKLSGARSSSRHHLLSVECANESSASGTCGNSGGGGHCGAVSLSTSPEDSFPEIGIKNESPKPCIDDELEVDIPSAGNLGNQGVHQDSEFPIEDGVMSFSYAEMNHCNDFHARDYCDMDDSSVLDSFSEYSYCDDNSDCQDDNSAEKEILKHCEQSSCSSREGYVSCQSFSSDDLENEGMGQVLSAPSYLPHLLCMAGNQAQKETFAESSRVNPSSGSLDHEFVLVQLKDPERSSSSSLAHLHSDKQADKSWTPTDAAKGTTQNISSGAVAVCVSGESLVERSSINPSSGSLNHKSVPIQLKDPERSSSSNLAHVHSDERADKSWTPTDAAKGITQHISSGEVAVCVDQSSKDVKCNSNTTDMLPEQGYQDASTTEEPKDKLIAAKCLNFESKDLNAVEAESNRILEAVNNACRAQLASEAIQTVTGGPIAEFERILYQSSPVVHEFPNFKWCLTCSRNQVPGSPLCRHDTTNISLGCIWRWYQRTGSYGLEVRAEEYRSSKGLGADHGAFHAYFVPYLSGIQLFRSCRSDSVVASTMGSTDLELLFEYFESEQPQQRQPLYDKIKELIRGDRPDSNVYGDPTSLETINLNDLHPRSWYSVAWYPIYRIPHGNLRAAFLTYHSLGHLVLRSANFESPGVDARIVSPVVGLQSYNAQDECWFQVRHSGPRQTTATPGPGVNSYGGVLKELLRTLEETAALMARAVVKKGSMTSVNRHPDYEFFLSRRR